MNQLVPVDAAYSQSLVPQSVGEAVKLAEFLSRSKLIPVGVQGSAADVFILLDQARRWNIDFFSLVQEVSVVHGRPMYSGKLTAALVNARGGLSKRLSYDYRGQDDNRTITVSGTIQGEDTPRVIEVRLGDAKTNNQQWTKQPDQMLMYHGARVWARRHTPELMLGIYGPEEFDDETPARSQKPRNPVTGEIIGEATVQPPAPSAKVTGGTPHDGDGVVLEDGIPGFLDRRGAGAAEATQETNAGDGLDPKEQFITSCRIHIMQFSNATALSKWWTSDEQISARKDFELSDEEVRGLTAFAAARRDELKAGRNGK